MNSWKPIRIQADSQGEGQFQAKCPRHRAKDKGPGGGHQSCPLQGRHSPQAHSGDKAFGCCLGEESMCSQQLHAEPSSSFQAKTLPVCLFASPRASCGQDVDAGEENQRSRNITPTSFLDPHDVPGSCCAPGVCRVLELRALSAAYQLRAF